MKKLTVILILLAQILSGCSLNEGPSNAGNDAGSTKEQAGNHPNENFITGYIIDKEKERLLVVEGLDELEFDINQQSVEEILKIADPNAIWINIDDDRVNDFSIGEKVRVIIDGGVNTSFPAQAAAKQIELVE
ncbi:YobA family protein [Paenibacillus urinalis]|uniref:YobA family protein n=1 Tax=Paenibacillus urinalis TaxID=521520 RepID=UPI0019613182